MGDLKKASKDKARARTMRSAAEKKVPRPKATPKTAAGKRAQNDLHELHVHQIELEMQNEELRASQASLEEARDKYVDLYDFAPVGYFTLSRGGLVLEVNLTGAAMLGVPRPKLLRRGLGRFVVPESLGLWDLHLASAFQSDQHHACELSFQRQDGSKFYARLDSVGLPAPAPAEPAGRHVPAVRMVLSDVTERRQLEETQLFLSQCGWTKADEDFFQSLAFHLARCLDMSYICIDRLEGDGLTARTVALYVDGAFHDNVQYALKDTPCGEVVDRAFCCFPRDVARMFPKDKVLRQIKAQSYAGVTLRDFRGKPIGLIAVIGQQPLANPRLAESVLKLVAVRAAGELERRRGEDELRTAHERLVEILRISPAFMCILRGPDHVFEMCNDKYFQVVGQRDILNRSVRQALPELEGQGFFELLDEVYQTGRPYTGKESSVRLQRTPGGPLDDRVVDFVYMPLREHDGTVTGVLVHGVDVTEPVSARRRVEQLALKAQLVSEELKRSNEDLAQFAYVAGHDLQEPLRMVRGFLGLLKEQYGATVDDKAREYVEYSVDGATRMSQLITDLLTYSRVDRKGNPMRPTDANEPLAAALANLRSSIEQAQALVNHEPLPTIVGDASQLTQLFQNLIGNALKFRSPGRPCRVDVSAQSRDDGWEFTIRDNGIGVPTDARDRVFMIFERLHTREKYAGTGIGLAICKKIVERHGGRIWVDSSPGEGSTFHFTLQAPGPG